MIFDFPPASYEASPKIVHECIVKTHEKKTEELWNIPISTIAQKHLRTMSEEELDADWGLNELFGTIAVINLPSAEKRLQLIKDELQSVGVHSFEVFSGIDGRKDLPQSIWLKLAGKDGEIDISRVQGQAGAYMSHYKLIQQVKSSFDSALEALKRAIDSCDENAIASAKEEVQRFSRVLILEDDAGFGFLKQNKVSKENAGVVLRKALRNLPNNWDILYFIVNATEPTTKLTEHLRKLNRSWSLVGYAVNYSMYGPLIDCLKKIEDPDVTQVWPVDNEIGEIQGDHNTYAIYPSIVFTQGGTSLITGRMWMPWQGQPIFPIPSEAKGLSCSPRVIVTLGSKCDFTAKDLQKKVDGVIVSGNKRDEQKKIIKQDQGGYNHVIILKNEFTGLDSLVKKLGYLHLHLNDTYENALNLLKDTLANTPKSDEDLPHNDPVIVGQFYDLLMKVDNVFKTNNIPYWATCGTLLGAVRHKGMIPWDDDIDLAIFESDVPRFLEVEETLNQLGLGIAYHPKYEFYKIFFLDGEPIYKENGETYPWKFPFVDILPLKNYKGKITYTGKIWYSGYQDQDYYTPEQLTFPLNELLFGPLHIPVPHSPVTYLTRMYGPDWNDVAYVTYSHRYEEVLTKIKVDLLNRLPPDYILQEK